MTDTIRIRTEVDFVAWETPDTVEVAIISEGDTFGIALAEVEPAVVDALAQQWLDHLYAKLNRQPPFKKVGQ